MSINKKNYIPELKAEINQENNIPNLITDDTSEEKRTRGLQRLFFLIAAIILFFVVIKIELPITGVAHVVPSQMLIVEALESGIIENVHFTSGQSVTKDDTIVTLHNYDLIRGLQESKLNRNKLRKKLLQLDRRRNYLRILVDNHEELYHDEIIARSELEKVKLDYTHSLQEYDIYKDELETLRSQIDYYQQSFDNMKIIAPISGIILTEIENKLGTFARKGDEICRVANMDDFILELPINEKYIDSIPIGTKATIRFSSYPHIPIDGTVTKIQHTAWEKLKKVLVKEYVINMYIQLENPDFVLNRG